MTAFLFDIGNVIVRFDFSQAALKFAALSTSSSEEVLAALSPFKDDLESGRISDADFVAASMQRIGFKGSYEQFVEIWGDIFSENTPMIQLINHLAANRVPLYLLSNTSGLHKEWLFAHFPVFSLFQGGIYSHEARCAKPHEEIFQQTITTLQLDPAKTVYVDDLADNAATSRRLGFVTHHYSPDAHGHLIAFLQERAAELGIEELISSFAKASPV